MAITDRHYIGDGVYIESDDFEPGVVKLSTIRENNVEHVIYLENQILENMLEWLKRHEFIKSYE